MGKLEVGVTSAIKFNGFKMWGSYAHTYPSNKLVHHLTSLGDWSWDNPCPCLHGVRASFHDFLRGHLDFTTYQTAHCFIQMKYHRNVYIVTFLLRKSLLTINGALILPMESHCFLWSVLALVVKLYFPWILFGHFIVITIVGFLY